MFLVLTATMMLVESTHASAQSFCKVGLMPREAAALVRLVVVRQIRGVKPKGQFSVDKTSNEPDARFYSFEALGVWNSGPGSAVLGNYSVNRRTATVWDTTLCERIRFPKLIRLQEHYCGSDVTKLKPDWSKSMDGPPTNC
jgi:hypothetical protein